MTPSGCDEACRLNGTIGFLCRLLTILPPAIWKSFQRGITCPGTDQEKNTKNSRPESKHRLA